MRLIVVARLVHDFLGLTLLLLAHFVHFQVVRNEIKYLLLDTVQLNGEIVGSSSPPFRMQDIFAIRCLLCPYKLLQWIRTTIRLGLDVCGYERIHCM